MNVVLEQSLKHVTRNFEYRLKNRPSVSVSRHLSVPNALSFFSGAMGLDIGLEKSGFEIRLCCEIDKHCRETIRENRPNVPLLGDIGDYTARQVLDFAGFANNDEIDLVVGGPPCQAFSTAGKRKGFKDDRGNIFLKFLDIALELSPKFIVIENVRGLLSCPMNHRPHNRRGPNDPPLSDDELRGGALNFVLNRLKTAGYGYSFNLYNSANFGTPQIRERVIVVCARDGSVPPYLQPTHSEGGTNGLQKWTTFRKAVKNIARHTHLEFPEKRLQYYQMLKEGQNWRNLPVEIQKEALGKSYFVGGGKTGFLRRLGWDKPSPTLVTHPAMPATDLAHPDKDRPLSIEEYKRIQEFPDDWFLAGPLVEKYKQIGNAVPISLGKAVGRLIKSLIQGERIEEYPSFQFSRYKKTNNVEWEEEFQRRKETNSSRQQFDLNLS